MSADAPTAAENRPLPPLALRVRGGARDGQLLKLSAAKCSIGASPGCTLRLRGKDVRAVHCLIVRGKANMVVRRWSADTLLNGQSFDDRPLELGDRLRCGPVEFEVVLPSGESVRPQPNVDALSPTPPGDVCATQAIACPEACSPTGTVVLGGPPPALVDSPLLTAPIARPQRLDAPVTATQPLPARASDCGTLLTAAEDAHAAAQAKRDERERQLSERETACAKREATLDERDTDLANRAADLEAREAKLRDREETLAGREEEIQRREQASLAASTAATPSDTASPGSGEDTAGAARRLAEERERLERDKREHEAQRAMHVAEHERWKEDHRQWKAQRQAAESQMEGLQAQVEHQLTEILSRRKHLDQDREAWKSESAQHRRQLEERAAEVARQAEEVDTWRKELDAERERAAALLEEASRYEQLCTELAEVRSQLAQRDGEIAAARRDVEHAQGEIARLQSASAAGDATSEQRATLARQAEELLQLRAQFEQERAAFEARVSGTGEVGETYPVQVGGDDSVSEDTGLSGLSTWALLKDKIDFADEAPLRQSPMNSPSPPVDAISDDQETINRYMANLMQRVGGRSTQPPPASAEPLPSAGSGDAPQQHAVAAAPTTSEAPPRTPQRTTKATKTVTPEEVARMRELANLNARVAITAHGTRQMLPQAFGKAALSLAAFGASAAVYLLNADRQPIHIAAAAGCALLGVFFFFGTLRSLRRLRTSRHRSSTESKSTSSRANTPPHPTPVEAAVVEDAPAATP